ncbi:TonB-dependent receptor [Novosphingobium kunmingense]|nr:TonB-dependent receptor [Novosphingobium kunmingense]
MFEALLLAAGESPRAAAPGPADAEQIVVTGERVTRSTLETASSVAVRSAQEIEALAGADRIEQVLMGVPNVQLGSGGEGPVIRGQDSTGAVRDLPAFLGGSRPRATIQVDGRPVTYYELAFGLTSLWDVNRIELFRSPQTTTQGRNSIGGAIFVETTDPDWTVAARARLIVGDFATWQGSAALTMPLVANQVAVRVAGDQRRSRTAATLRSTRHAVDLNQDESDLLRVKLRVQPEAVAGLRLDLGWAKGQSRMPQAEAISPPYEARTNPSVGYGYFVIDTDSWTARASYAPGGPVEARLMATFGLARAQRFSPPGAGEARLRSRDLSVEPIVTLAASPALRLVGGASYIRTKLDQTIDVSRNPGFGIGTFDDVQNSLGLFADAELKPAARVTLRAGLRYQRDDQRRGGGFRGGFRDLDVAYDRAFSAWLPRFEASYAPSPQWRLGALVQRAANPGGMTINTATFTVDTFEAETLWDVELFARLRTADGRLSLGLNAFRYAMRNAQRTQTFAVVRPGGGTDLATEIANAPRAQSLGAELQADWKPDRRLTAGAAIGLLRTRITQTIDPADPMLGQEFQRSPRLTASLAVDWRPFDPLRLSAQVRTHSGYFSDDFGMVSRRVDAAATLDLRAAYTLGPITLSGFARNAANAFQLTYRYGSPSNLATVADPLELGAGLELRF